MTALPEKLPQQLIAKQWRGNKGLFTKAVSDATGMGASLDRLEKAWTAVPWTTVDPNQAVTNAAPTGDVTIALLDKLEPPGRKYQTQVEAARRELRAVEALAKKTGDSWKANKLVPASSVKYVGQVQAAAAALAKGIDELDEAWKAYRFNAEHGRMQRTDKAIVETEIRGAVASLRATAQAQLDKPSLTAYRNMGQALSKSIAALAKSDAPAHQAVKTRLEKLAAERFNPKNSDEAE